MATHQTVWTTCASCDRDTKHDILFSADESEEDYPIDRSYQVVQCRGCENKSFRKSVAYIADAQQDDDNEWHVPTDVSTYPPVLKGHRSLPDIARAPKTVRAIYRETLDAIKNQSYTLAGIGLRATIEAICNDRQISGRNLEVRIDKLTKAGFVSQADADRLHAIRFMGNDAAHDIQPADLESLLVALRIVEHLIVSLYILDKDADGVLQTLIKTYPEFEAVLNMQVLPHPAGAELPLAVYLGREARRFHGYLKSHEATLSTNISGGTFTSLKLGRMDTYAGSREKFQHYVKV